MNMFKTTKLDVWIMRVAIAVGVIAVVYAFVWLPLWQGFRGERLEAKVAAPEGLRSPEIPSSVGTAVTWGDTLQVQVADPSVWVRFSAALPGLLLVAVVLSVSYVLYGMVASAERGDPFAWRTAFRLRALGTWLWPIPWIWQLLNRYADGEVLSAALDRDPGSSEMDFTISLPYFLIPIGVLILAQIFLRGLRLHEEVEATV